MFRPFLAVTLSIVSSSCLDECKELGAVWCLDEFQQATCSKPVKFEMGNQEVVRDCRLWTAVCTSGREGGKPWAECTLAGETCGEEEVRTCRGGALLTCRRGLWVVAPCMGCAPDPVQGARCN